MRAAAVYLRGGQFFIHSESKTTAGVWIMTQPHFRIPETAADSELASAIAQSIVASKAGVPHPTSWKGSFDPILRLAGTKSWKAFSRDARCLNLYEEDSILTITPTRSLGPGKAFVPIQREEVKVGLSSEVDVARLVRELAAASKTSAS